MKCRSQTPCPGARSSCHLLLICNSIKIDGGGVLTGGGWGSLLMPESQEVHPLRESSVLTAGKPRGESGLPPITR